jgi:hypothetical protein
VRSAARLFAAIAILAAGNSVAETYGVIDVSPLQGLGGNAVADYVEHSIRIVNRDSSPHQVGVAIVSSTYRRGTQRVSRSFLVPSRSSIDVKVEQPVPADEASREITVSVDGRQRYPVIGLPGGRGEEAVVQLLMSRSFPEMYLKPGLSFPETPEPGIPPTSPPRIRNPNFHYVRAEVSPEQWSTNWLAYTGFHAILTTSTDWTEFPPSVKTAVMRQVRTGAPLVFVGNPATLPDVRWNRQAGPFQTGSLGFGTVFSIPELTGDLPLNSAAELRLQIDRSSRSRGLSRPPYEELPLLNNVHVPSGALFSTLLMFAVVSGPVSLVVLARRNRRLWIFWTVPLLAILSGATIILVSLGAEGWQRVSRSGSVTLLDEDTGEATTLGVVGFYSTLPPDGRIRFSSDTEIVPWVGSSGSTDLDTSEGQRFVSGWVRSRVSTYFAFRKSEHRRERLSIRPRGNDLIALNGLGTRIERLYFADATGVIHEASAIEPGARAILRRTARVAGGTMQLQELAGPPETWVSVRQRLAADHGAGLAPQMYAAVLSASPFVDRALEHPKTSTSEAALIGMVRRQP